jgi:hypothetical protein
LFESIIIIPADLFCRKNGFCSVCFSLVAKKK